MPTKNVPEIFRHEKMSTMKKVYQSNHVGCVFSHAYRADFCRLPSQLSKSAGHKQKGHGSFAPGRLEDTLKVSTPSRFNHQVIFQPWSFFVSKTQTLGWSRKNPFESRNVSFHHPTKKGHLQKFLGTLR